MHQHFPRRLFFVAAILLWELHLAAILSWLEVAPPKNEKIRASKARGIREA